jgi:hypothetical protein
MPFPTTPILDSFNRANEGPPPSASWGGNWYGGAAGLVVASNLLGAEANGAGYWLAPFAADQECYLTLINIAGAQSNLICRMTNPGAGYNAYQVEWFHGTNTARFRKTVGGADTFLGAAFATDPFTTAGDVIGMRVVADTITAYINGVFQGGTTDSSIGGPGAVGLYTDSSGNTFDDFGGGKPGGGDRSSPFPPMIGGWGA